MSKKTKRGISNVPDPIYKIYTETARSQALYLKDVPHFYHLVFTHLQEQNSKLAAAIIKQSRDEAEIQSKKW